MRFASSRHGSRAHCVAKHRYWYSLVRGWDALCPNELSHYAQRQQAEATRTTMITWP